MRFTSQQAAILSEIEGCFRVLAAAGSGKTTTMAHYVKSELESKRLKESEICFITFTRFAADQIRTKIWKILGRRVSVLYGTFNATMYKLLFMAGLEPLQSKGLYDARMEEGVRHFIHLMETRDDKLVRVLSKFKLLIVDEFQDLDEAQFQFVKHFKAIQPDLRVVAIGDLAQNIYRFRGTSNEFLRTRLQKEVSPDLKTFELTTNFRSSECILTAVNTVFGPEINDGHILPMSAPVGAGKGSKPKYFEYAKNPGKGLGEYEELVVTTLLPVITDAKKAGKSVVLIFPIIKCASFQIITALLRQLSKRSGYAFDIHQIAKEDETCSTISFDYNPKCSSAPIQCSSFHASKGLEWDVVAIINMSDRLYEIRGEEEDTEAFYAEKTNLAYVGITRAVEELYIFADANCGGRCRIFSRLEGALADVMDVTLWGEDVKEEAESGRLRPVGITDLLRKLPQQPDLYERAKKCSEGIRIHAAKDGDSIPMETVYTEMKKRNRELAFGTFVDWKLKSLLCKKKPIQHLLLELKMASESIIPRTDAYDSLEMRLEKLDVYFLNSGKGEPSEDLIRYVTASRYLALFTGRMYSMVPAVKEIWYAIQDRILEVAGKPTDTLTVFDEYILAHSIGFYTRGIVSEIQSIDAPSDSYQGQPEGFEEFVSEVIRPAGANIQACIQAVGVSPFSAPDIQCDISLETESLILGEVDMLCGDFLIEIKCGTATRAVELRDAGNCKNLLQVLSYVALGRHGTIPLACKYAGIINPLTATWEIYDIESWSLEDSLEFIKVLEELRVRT